MKHLTKVQRYVISVMHKNGLKWYDIADLGQVVNLIRKI